MSVGRNLCKTLIDTPADMRRYAELLQDFAPAEVGLLVHALRAQAHDLERLIPSILEFEGERLPAIEAARNAEREKL